MYKIEILFLLIGLGLCWTHFAFSYLYPKDSETRETKSLDGIWNFNILPQSERDKLFGNISLIKNFEVSRVN